MRRRSLFGDSMGAILEERERVRGFDVAGRDVRLEVVGEDEVDAALASPSELMRTSSESEALPPMRALRLRSLFERDGIV